MSSGAVAGQIMIALLAGVVVSVLLYFIAQTTLAQSQLTVRDSASAAQAQAVATPVEYLGGSRAVVTMCNTTANCQTISPLLECARTGLDYDGCSRAASRAACTGVCEWGADSRCRLRPAADAHRRAPDLCHASDPVTCGDEHTCAWNPANRFCSDKFDPESCAEPCRWLTCASYKSNSRCTRAGCAWSSSSTTTEQQCSYRGAVAGSRCADVGAKCASGDFDCRYTQCVRNGCRWSGECDRGRCTNGGAKCSSARDCEPRCVNKQCNTNAAKTCSTDADCASGDAPACVDPGRCGMCEAGFCGTLDTHTLRVEGAKDTPYDGTYDPQSDGSYGNGTAVLRWYAPGSRWGFFATEGDAAPSYVAPVGRHLPQQRRAWVAPGSGAAPMFPGGGGLIESSLCASYPSAAACATDVSCLWDYADAACRSTLDAVRDPWCTPCDRLAACPAGGCVPPHTAGLNSTSRCASRAGLPVPGGGVCPDLLTPCGAGPDCYACTNGFCPDRSTECSSRLDCAEAVCHATPGVMWDQESGQCVNRTCWGECRVPVHVSDGGASASRTCDDELLYAFAEEMGRKSTDTRYAKKDSTGRYVWKDRETFVGACRATCADCPAELKTKCGGCAFTTASGQSCEDACPTAGGG